MFGHWRQGIRSRFAGRENLEPQAAYEEYWSDFPRQAVMELFQFIETEYELAPGLLRPDDDLSKLLQPIKPVSFLKWLFYQARTEDSASELNYQLGKREHRYGTQEVWHRVGVKTIDELVRAWCGRLPRNMTTDEK